ILNIPAKAKWAQNGVTIAGDLGDGVGNRLDQVRSPSDVLTDKETDSLIICNRDNRRVVRCSRHSDTIQGEILINNIVCWGLTLDDHRSLYVSNDEKDEVKRYQLGDKIDTLVAGANGTGSRLN
ncbi:unnamed protein product, partial [Rotaria socialis]